MSLEAFKNRVLPSRDKMYRFALRLLKNEEEAEDVVQEALLRAWQNIEKLLTYDSMEAWCMRVVRNLAYDRLKSKNYRQDPLDDSLYNLEAPQPGPAQATESNEMMQNIHHYIEQLPDKQKQVMILRDIEGFSYNEIADILGLNMSSVKVNLFRARQAVREKLLKLSTYGLEQS